MCHHYKWDYTCSRTPFMKLSGDVVFPKGFQNTQVHVSVSRDVRAILTNHSTPHHHQIYWLLANVVPPSVYLLYFWNEMLDFFHFSKMVPTMLRVGIGKWDVTLPWLQQRQKQKSPHLLSRRWWGFKIEEARIDWMPNHNTCYLWIPFIQSRSKLYRCHHGQQCLAPVARKT